MEGEYVPKHPTRSWKGYRISKIFNKYVTLRELYKKWVDAQGHDRKVQVFWNSDLGLPFSSKGSRITEADLNACKDNYPTPKPGDNLQNPRVVGIDVGAVLHYVVRDIVVVQGIRRLRLLEAGSYPTFELLEKEVLDKWNVRIGVIDALPEIHKVMEMKAHYSRIHSSRFQMDKRTMVHNKNDKEVTMDRTAILDYVKQAVDDEKYILPMNAEFIDNSQYYSHMMSSTRILEVDEDNPEKNRFIWAHSKPDHYFLAEAYCLQAYMLMPNVDIFDFFNEHGTNTATQNVDDITGISEEKKAELEKLARISPEMVMNNMQTNYAKSRK
jgi:hypothetical protein